MSTRISIPRGLPPPLPDELSMLFSDYFGRFVKNDPVYLGLNRVTWNLPFPLERLSLLPQELTPELVFRSPLDKVLCRIVTCWDANDRTVLVDEFLANLFRTSLFGQVYEALSARNATQLTRPRFESAFKQVWFGQYSWDNMSNRRLQTCGFQHVYINGLVCNGKGIFGNKNEVEGRCSRGVEMLRPIGQYLCDKGLNSAHADLSTESGVSLEHDDATELRHATLEGRWNDAEAAVDRLAPLIRDLDSADEIRLLLLEQRFLEHLEANEAMHAVTLLRNRITSMRCDERCEHGTSSHASDLFDMSN
ncbi:hypothetical protein T265_08207 [Opisthorchis viverrini]|uniref:CTLH domain-containing protein n=1 Tax=Opisthorchis viverrini TaxID=6198 RepID=A0A074Z9W6_OPIVI|nr:hypothetical protein T265_08207 [Opisthorchis viverrini]KER24036.1 hypothetical protein T265_08207 [Opisthorchis viverrini]